MTIKEKFLDIITTMIEYNMLDISKLYDKKYVLERVKTYLETKSFVDTNFKGMF